MMAKKPVRIRDVAEKAGVSPGAVSLVMNDNPGVSEKTRKKVLKAAKTLGYVPSFLARGLRRKKSDAVLFVFPTSSSNLFLRMLQGINVQVERFNYPVVMSCTHDDADIERYTLEMFRHIYPSGIMIAPVPGGQNTEMINQIVSENKIPLIVLERQDDSLKGDYIGSDNEEAGYYAAKMLIEKGHKKIGGIFNIFDYSTDTERMEGFQRAMDEAGLEIKPEWILQLRERVPKNTIKAAEKYFSQPDRPDAVLWCIGMGETVLSEALENCSLKTPDDVEIILFDCDELETPVGQSFMNIMQDSVVIGREAIRVLNRRLAEIEAGGERTDSKSYRVSCLKAVNEGSAKVRISDKRVRSSVREDGTADEQEPVGE